MLPLVLEVCVIAFYRYRFTAAMAATLARKHRGGISAACSAEGGASDPQLLVSSPERPWSWTGPPCDRPKTLDAWFKIISSYRVAQGLQ